METRIKQQTSNDFPSKNYKSRFISKLSDSYVFTLTEQISFFRVGLAGTYFVTNENKKFFINHKLKEVEAMLDPAYFFRINRSYIISINSIKEIIKFSNRRLKVVITNSTDQNILISREKVSEFKAWIDS